MDIGAPASDDIIRALEDQQVSAQRIVEVLKAGDLPPEQISHFVNFVVTEITGHLFTESNAPPGTDSTDTSPKSDATDALPKSDATNPSLNSDPSVAGLAVRRLERIWNDISALVDLVDSPNDLLKSNSAISPNTVTEHPEVDDSVGGHSADQSAGFNPFISLELLEASMKNTAVDNSTGLTPALVSSLNDSLRAKGRDFSSLLSIFFSLLGFIKNQTRAEERKALAPAREPPVLYEALVRRVEECSSSLKQSNEAILRSTQLLLGNEAEDEVNLFDSEEARKRKYYEDMWTKTKESSDLARRYLGQVQLLLGEANSSREGYDAIKEELQQFRLHLQRHDTEANRRYESDVMEYKEAVTRLKRVLERKQNGSWEVILKSLKEKSKEAGETMKDQNAVNALNGFHETVATISSQVQAFELSALKLAYVSEMAQVHVERRLTFRL